MSLHIYNSLTKKKEPFVPLEGNVVKMYSCGVTVYDKCHIGHARSLYIFDVIRRYLKYRGYDVRFVRNITDIDDKIINKARELGVDSKDVAEKNIGLYYQDMDSLGVGKADIEPRATENINDMIRHIQGLIDSGAAYEAEGDVYFSVRKFPDYGKLSGQSIEKMLEGVRIESDEKKRDPLDFALWKHSKEGEPSCGDSPPWWGPGRPGWHIECSCMSLKHLRCETLDIHAGGRDLIFPHHENEIAQAEALTGKPFAKYWIHHGLITINDQKMSKSLGNFITVEDAVKRFGPDDLKLFFLASHYSSPIDFSEEKIAEAHKARQRFAVLAQDAARLNGDAARLEPHPDAQSIIDAAQAAFIEAMDDDFNTPKALGVLFELVTDAHKYKGRPGADYLVCQAFEMIQRLCENIFGVNVRFQTVSKELKFVYNVNGISVQKTVEELLQERQEARKNKNFKKSDDLRVVLKEQHGIIVEDTPQGQQWREE